jgi:hypothetical protein
MDGSRQTQESAHMKTWVAFGAGAVAIYTLVKASPEIVPRGRMLAM